MNERLSDWWGAVMVAGTPALPYVGLVLLFLAGLIVLCLVLYFLYRLVRALPRLARYLKWRFGSLAQRMRIPRRLAARPVVVARIAGLQDTVALRDSFGRGRWPWRRYALRPDVPLILVLGQSGAARSRLLRNVSADAYNRRPLVETVTTAPVCVWWSLDNALALEIPSTLPQACFAELIHTLEKLRPGSPFSHVVATVPAKQFVLPASDATSDLSFAASFLAELYALHGRSIALRLVIDDMDELTGFQSFIDTVGESHAAAQFRVAPTAGEETYSAMFSAWVVRLQELATQSCVRHLPVAGFGERGASFAFIHGASIVLEAAAAWLTDTRAKFQQPQAGLLLESVCMHATVHRGTAPVPIPSIDFTTRETVLASPRRATMSLRQAARLQLERSIALAAVAISTAIVCTWLPIEITGMRRDAQGIELLAASMRRDMAQASYPSQHGPDPRSISWLLDAVARVDDHWPWALLAPRSWVDRRQQDLLEALGGAIQRDLLMPRFEFFDSPVPVADPSVVRPATAVSAEQIRDVPSFIELKVFLAARDLADSSTNAAKSLNTGITYSELVRFLGDEPSRFVSPGWKGSGHLPSAVTGQFDTSRLQDLHKNQPQVRQLLDTYWERLLQESLDRHPIIVAHSEVSDALRRLGRGQVLSPREAAELGSSLRWLARELDSPSAKRLTGSTTEMIAFFNPALNLLGKSNTVAMTQVAEYSTSLTKRRDLVRRRLGSQDLPGVGKLIAVDAVDASLTASAELKRFSALWDSFMAQSFMQRVPQAGDAHPVGALSDIVVWNLQELESAREMAASFREFSTAGLQSVDAGIRASILRTAQTQTRRAIDDVFWRSMQKVSAVDISAVLGDPMAGLRQQINNFGAATRLYRTLAINPVPSGEMAPVPTGGLDELFTGNALLLLARMDKLLRQDDPYVLILADTQSWLSTAEERPLETVLRGGVKERIALARDSVRTQYAVHAATLLEAMSQLSPAALRDDRVQHWRRMVDVLEGFDKGATANGLYEFEYYLLTLSRLKGPADCSRFLAERASTPHRSDYFSIHLTALDARVNEICVRRSLNAAQRSYGTFAAWFNTTAAGRTPFVAANMSSSATAPLALSRRAFQAVLARYAEMRRSLPERLGSEWPRDVGQFITRMDGLSAWFGQERARGATDSATAAVPGNNARIAELSIRARLEPRSNVGESTHAGQIIDVTVVSGARTFSGRGAIDGFEWRMSEPIEVRFRWANNSTHQPVASNGPGAAYTVSGKTVTFRYAGDWALVEMIKRHAVRGDGSEEISLQFPVHVVTNDGRQVALPHMTLQAFADQPFISLDIPERAPVLLFGDPNATPSFRLETSR